MTESRFSLFTAHKEYLQQKTSDITSQILNLNNFYTASNEDKYGKRIQKHYTPICIYSNTISITYINDITILKQEQDEEQLSSEEMMTASNDPLLLTNTPTASIKQNPTWKRADVAFKFASELAKKRELRDKLEVRLKAELATVAKVHKSQVTEIRKYEKKSEDEKVSQNQAIEEKFQEMKAKQSYLKKLGLTTKKALGLDKKKDEINNLLDKSIEEINLILHKVKEIKEKTHTKNYSINIEKLLFGSKKNESEMLNVDSPIVEDMNKLSISSIPIDNSKSPSSKEKSPMFARKHRHGFTPKSDKKNNHDYHSPSLTEILDIEKEQEKIDFTRVNDPYNSRFGHQMKNIVLQELKESVCTANNTLDSSEKPRDNENKIDSEDITMADLVEVRKFLKEIQGLDNLTEKYHLEEDLLQNTRMRSKHSCSGPSDAWNPIQSNDYIYCKAHNPVNTKKRTVTKERKKEIKRQQFESEQHPAFLNVVRVKDRTQPINGYGNDSTSRQIEAEQKSSVSVKPHPNNLNISALLRR